MGYKDLLDHHKVLPESLFYMTYLFQSLFLKYQYIFSQKILTQVL